MIDENKVAGIDGCKSGWIIATTTGVSVQRHLHLDDFVLAGIDMPMGLVDGPPRPCDVAARRYLQYARSSVFPAPPRAALGCTNYRDALAASRAATGRGISKQTFNLIAKIAELDLLLGSTNRHAVIEVHPECSFKALNDGLGLPSKKTVAGQDIRRRLLASHFDVPSSPPPGAATDDVLDAYAVLWSARRYQRGEHQVFGDESVDPRGIRMRIIC